VAYGGDGGYEWLGGSLDTLPQLKVADQRLVATTDWDAEVGEIASTLARGA